MKSGIPVSILVLADILPEFLLGSETAIGGCGQLGVGEDNSGADLIFDLNIFTCCNRPEKMSADHAKNNEIRLCCEHDEQLVEGKFPWEQATCSFSCTRTGVGISSADGIFSFPQQMLWSHNH